MSLLTQTQERTNILTDHPKAEIGSNKRDELTIVSKSSYVHTSAMNEDLKSRKRESAPALSEMFTNTLSEKNVSAKSTWTGENEVEVEGLSKMTLHSFILKAEELGKKIKYTRSLTVEITD